MQKVFTKLLEVTFGFSQNKDETKTRQEKVKKSLGLKAKKKDVNLNGTLKNIYMKELYVSMEL